MTKTAKNKNNLYWYHNGRRPIDPITGPFQALRWLVLSVVLVLVLLNLRCYTSW